MNPFTVAVERAGGIAELCRRLSAVDGGEPVTPQVFVGWRRRGQVPEGRVWQFVAATGIPPWEVRPDIYERPSDYWSRVAKFCGVQACASEHPTA